MRPMMSIMNMLLIDISISVLMWMLLPVTKPTCQHQSFKPSRPCQGPTPTVQLIPTISRSNITMLIEETHQDVTTKAGGDMRIFIFKPTIAGYPNAKFPGVVVWSEIYQGMAHCPF